MAFTDAKLVPSIIGIFPPMNFPIPSDCVRVAIPAINKSAFIRNKISLCESPAALPTISGTATAPAHIASTCCSANASVFPNGSFSSTGAVVFTSS